MPFFSSQAEFPEPELFPTVFLNPCAHHDSIDGKEGEKTGRRCLKVRRLARSGQAREDEAWIEKGGGGEGGMGEGETTAAYI